jgi:predicted SAM-dependent methyltransferase
MKLNVGCGYFPMEGWLNLDADARCLPDVCANVPPLPCRDNELAEIFAGHFLEHLDRASAARFLRECYRTLQPGGRLGIVVPDAVEIFRHWLNSAVDEIEYPEGVWRPIADLDAVNELFVYSTVQDPPHAWLWEARTLARAMQAAGFQNLQRINRFSDPRLACPAWYQDGIDGYKPTEE